MLAYPYILKDDSISTASVTTTFGQTSDDMRCALNIKEGFDYLKEFLTGNQTYVSLTSNFNTCEPVATKDDV